MQIAKEKLMRLIADMTAIPNTDEEEETVESADVIKIIDSMCKKQKETQKKHCWHLVPTTSPCFEGDKVVRVTSRCPVCGGNYAEVYSAHFVESRDDKAERTAMKTACKRMSAEKRFCSVCGTRLYIPEEAES